jgi:hypothetical protein
VVAFIALLKVTVTTVLGQEPAAALAGPTETAVGGVFDPGLGESLHPVANISSKNAANNILILIFISILGLSFPRMNIILHPLG